MELAGSGWPLIKWRLMFTCAPACVPTTAPGLITKDPVLLPSSMPSVAPLFNVSAVPETAGRVRLPPLPVTNSNVPALSTVRPLVD